MSLACGIIQRVQCGEGPRRRGSIIRAVKGAQRSRVDSLMVSWMGCEAGEEGPEARLDEVEREIRLTQKDLARVNTILHYAGTALRNTCHPCFHVIKYGCINSPTINKGLDNYVISEYVIPQTE